MKAQAASQSGQSSLGAKASMAPSHAHGTSKPQRIVSLNLCTDQILLQLVPRERIVGITRLSTDPHNTVMHRQAQGLTTVRGNAEEVMALNPDLVLVGTYTTRHTTAMLRRFGIRTVAIAGANSFEAVRTEMREVAKAVGEVARGEALIQAFDARLAELESLPASKTVSTRYSAGGYSAGSHTMDDDILRAAGHINAAAQAGIQGYRQLPLEQLMVQAPQILIGNDHKPGDSTQANRMLSHPAIQNLNARSVTLAAKHTICGGIWNLDAVQHLTQQAQGLTAHAVTNLRKGE